MDRRPQMYIIWGVSREQVDMVKYLKHSVKPLDATKVQPVEASYSLRVVQQPVKARVAGRKQTRNSSRRLVDPQPVVEIRLDHPGMDNVIDHSLSTFFVRALIECLGLADKEQFFQKQRKLRFFDKSDSDEEVLRGTTTVSAQFYRGSPYTACAVFDNLLVRYKGNYRLRFDLYELQTFGSGGLVPKIIHWTKLTSYSLLFTVYTDAAFDGLEASPELNNELKKAGCKIRARKQRNVPSGMMDLEGFRVLKKMTYSNGQMHYQMGTNHFGLDDAIFNRPGTSMDMNVYQSYHNAQAAAAQAAANISNNMSTSSSFLSPQPMEFNPVKRPQTALPQLITTGDHFNYQDMLRLALTPSEYHNLPIEQPQPRRFNIQSAGPFSAYSEMLSMESAYPKEEPLNTPSLTNTPVAMANNHGQLNSYTVANSNTVGTGIMMGMDQFLLPQEVPRGENTDYWDGSDNVDVSNGLLDLGAINFQI